MVAILQYSPHCALNEPAVQNGGPQQRHGAEKKPKHKTQKFINKNRKFNSQWK
jgi:hypothetical protein